MIKNIVIRYTATFDENGVFLDNLAKINFFYGGNDTGKTTISNYLSDMDNPDFTECSCGWEDGGYERIIVYNKKIRENTILNDTIIPGVK
ncbi:MAG: AAA family ATPase [Bacteroidaceae bacterium]|nr:AAA family ATPase [Bacteroidaceae bacterium]